MTNGAGADAAPSSESMRIIDLHHVSLAVTDLERARAFYRDVLGLCEVARPDFDFAGVWFRAGERQLHLIVNPTARTLRGETDLQPCEAHVALRIESYRDAVEHLTALGVHHEAKPVNRTAWPQIFLADPDGNMIELNAEWLD